jgi:hypothetical protein
MLIRDRAYDEDRVRATIFLLSPARCSGERAEILMTSEGSSLGKQLRSKNGAPLGDVFAWLSALYFRGKLAYARRFSPLPPLVIAPGAGLPPADVRILAGDLRAMGAVDVSSTNERFVAPLRRDAGIIAARSDIERVVLLGSIASGKYTDTLLELLGPRLLFPSDFVGRGDMSRGGLMLRAARSGEELAYSKVAGAVLRGKRPPKLPRPR